MQNPVSIAVIGASSLLGTTLLELLEERDFPVAAAYLLDEESSASRVEFKGHYHSVAALEGFDFGQVQLVFVCSPSDQPDLGQEAVEAGCVVIDCRPNVRHPADVAQVIPELNGDDLAQVAGGARVGNPPATAIPLLLALAPLQAKAGVSRLIVTTFQAASGGGRAAIDELAQQTVDLLNMRDVRPRVHAKQSAFNVIPCVGARGEDGSTEAELAMEDAVRRFLPSRQLEMSVTASWVPVFYADSLAVNVVTEHALSVEAARDLFASSAGLVLLDDPSPEGYPTAVSEAAKSDSVFMGRLRRDRAHRNGLSFWLTGDNMRKGSALNGVQIAEKLLKTGR